MNWSYSKVPCFGSCLFLLLHCLRIWSIKIMKSNGVRLSPCVTPLFIEMSTDFPPFKQTISFNVLYMFFILLIRVWEFLSSARLPRVGILVSYQMQTVDPVHISKVDFLISAIVRSSVCHRCWSCVSFLPIFWLFFLQFHFHYFCQFLLQHPSVYLQGCRG